MKRSLFAVALVALAVAPALANPTDDVRSAMLRFAGLSSYQMAFDSGKNSGTMEIVRPDSMRMRATGMEMVRVGNTTYMKTAGRNWMKIESASGGAFGNEIASKVRSLATTAKGITVSDLGMKSADGQMMHAYHVKQNDGAESTMYVAGDGFIHRMDSAEHGSHQTVRFSRFNAVPAIRAPI